MSGGKADVAKDKSHARFAAACAVNDLMCEVPAWKVAETWGKPDTVSKAGTSSESRTSSSAFAHLHRFCRAAFFDTNELAFVQAFLVDNFRSCRCATSLPLYPLHHSQPAYVLEKDQPYFCIELIVCMCMCMCIVTERKHACVHTRLMWRGGRPWQHC